jgi:hypothetical protein
LNLKISKYDTEDSIEFNGIRGELLLKKITDSIYKNEDIKLG